MKLRKLLSALSVFLILATLLCSCSKTESIESIGELFAAEFKTDDSVYIATDVLLDLKGYSVENTSTNTLLFSKTVDQKNQYVLYNTLTRRIILELNDPNVIYSKPYVKSSAIYFLQMIILPIPHIPFSYTILPAILF